MPLYIIDSWMRCVVHQQCMQEAFIELWMQCPSNLLIKFKLFIFVRTRQPATSSRVADDLYFYWILSKKKWPRLKWVRELSKALFYALSDWVEVCSFAGQPRVSALRCSTILLNLLIAPLCFLRSTRLPFIHFFALHPLTIAPNT